MNRRCDIGGAYFCKDEEYARDKHRKGARIEQNFFYTFHCSIPKSYLPIMIA